MEQTANWDECPKGCALSCVFLLVSFSTWIWILPPQAGCQLHKSLWSLEFLGPLQNQLLHTGSSQNTALGWLLSFFLQVFILFKKLIYL